MNRQAEEMLNISLLPLMKDGCRIHYEGSIDKKGGNADWDWGIYQDDAGEWVLFEADGPGCILNFVQHRYPDCTEPTFRFYFDGEEKPRFTIRHSQFGECYPFVEPAASRYIGPFDNGRGPIRVVRSFIPMAFSKGCRVTSDILLTGNDRMKNEGGWGHIIYQTYSDQTKVRGTFCREDAGYQELCDAWKAGYCPSQVPGSKEERQYMQTLEPDDSLEIYRDDAAGCILGIQLQFDSFDREDLSGISVEITFDGHDRADAAMPLGCFAGNELGYHSVSYRLCGMDAQGMYYFRFPMPYERAASVVLKNNLTKPRLLVQSRVISTREYNSLYADNEWGYFRTSPYYDRKHTEGRDSIIGHIYGSGHLVGAVVTGFGESSEKRADCEGDVRVHIDGCRTPSVESDGSESYICYGWGFETPREQNPASGYDGYRHTNWSMCRLLMGDWYPFLSELRFGIESGGCNDCYMEHSGILFYYGRDEKRLVSLVKTENSENGQISCSEQASYSELTSYFEGDDDDIPVTLCGRYARKVNMEFFVPEDVGELMIRRVSDQQKGRQRARVIVNGTGVAERDWYVADRNPFKRFLEDEFVIPVSYVKPGSRNRIEICPLEEGGETSWNSFGCEVFGILKTARRILNERLIKRKQMQAENEKFTGNEK